MLIAGMLSLAAGSSGTFMIMAGLETQNLYIQLVRAVCIVFLSLLLIPSYGMISVVLLYFVFMLFVNVSQLIYIKQRINISPFSAHLNSLLFFTILTMYFAVNQDYSFGLVHFVLVPIGVYALYFALMFNPIKSLVKEL